MRLRLLFPAYFIAFTLILLPIRAQRDLSGEIKIRQALEKLDTVGSAMMIGAHPDDEKTQRLSPGWHGGVMFVPVICPSLEERAARTL